MTEKGPKTDEEFKKVFPEACRDMGKLVAKHGEHLATFVCAIAICRYFGSREHMHEKMDMSWEYYESMENSDELD